MKLEEAIIHSQEYAERNRDTACGAEHQQIADWLRILQRMLKGAERIEHLAKFGSAGHSAICNYPNAHINGQKWCNCGFADIVCAKEDFKE